MTQREASTQDDPLQRSRARAGTLGMLGGLLWLGALLVEHGLDLVPPGHGASYVADQLLFAAAMVCYVAALLGLQRSGAAGHGKAASTVVAGWAVGWLLVLIGLLTALIAPSLALGQVLPAVGGLVTAICGVATGILVIRAALWPPWQRGVPIAVASYVVLALFVPQFLGAEPSLPIEAGWALGYALLGAALRTATPRKR